MQDLRDDAPYPFKFSPLLKEKIWGGHRLARMLGRGRSLEESIGEAWLVWDGLAVSNGPWRGKTLGELVGRYPLQVLGRGGASEPQAVFPLLVKLIDTREFLSVQVHPDDDYARSRESQPFGKYEMWYVVEADPQSRIIHGVRSQVTRFELKEAVQAGRLPEVLSYVEVEAGDVIMNPPGTIHALGSGILIYELQQSSDLTYRLYDWDRGRTLHVDKGVEVARLEPSSPHRVQPVTLEEPGGTRTFLGACRHFAAELLELQAHITARPGGRCFHILTVLRGCGHVRCANQPAVAFAAGESVLVPAGIPEYQVQPEEDAVIAKSYVPDLLEDVVGPLRERGVARDRILQLGGDPGGSDLVRYIR